jgi:hypothetical protein
MTLLLITTFFLLQDSARSRLHHEVAARLPHLLACKTLHVVIRPMTLPHSIPIVWLSRTITCLAALYDIAERLHKFLGLQDSSRSWPPDDVSADIADIKIVLLSKTSTLLGVR